MMNRVRSVSLFVGTGACNARCAHCAGLVHRKAAPMKDGIADTQRIISTLTDCYHHGARSLSLSSSGEPTLSPLSVTKVLEITHGLNADGIAYAPIHLYTNGIRIGEDPAFCDTYLRRWQSLGLGSLYVTVHDIDEKRNAAVYGVTSYPPLARVFSRIHDAGLTVRANLLLSRKTISTLDTFVATVDHLKRIGADRIAAWPLRGADDRIDPIASPPKSELDAIGSWIQHHQDNLCSITLLGESTHAAYGAGEKLTLFPDGVLSSTWCAQLKKQRMSA